MYDDWEDDYYRLLNYAASFGTRYELERYGDADIVKEMSKHRLAVNEITATWKGQWPITCPYHTAYRLFDQNVDTYKSEEEIHYTTPFSVCVMTKDVFQKRLQLTDFNSLVGLKRADRALYEFARANDLSDDKFITEKLSNKAMNFEEVEEVALQYNTTKEFKENAPKAFHRALRMRWLPKISFKEDARKKSKHTDADIAEKASLYDTRSQFRLAYPYLYRLSLKTGLIDRLFPKHKKT